MRTQLFVTLLALALTMPVWAQDGNEFYDFKVNGIAYKINEDLTTVSVAKEQDPNVAETNYTSYANLTGTLSLPEEVTHNGQTYTVTAIGLEAFQGCAGLTGDLVLPKTITMIDHWAFYECSGLTGHVVIPDGVTSIGYGAFGGCEGIEGFTIPRTVRQLDPGSLEATGLQTVVSLVDNFDAYAVMLNRRAFRYVGTGVDMASCRLLVPASALSLYQSFVPWSLFEQVDVLENVDRQGQVDVSDVNMTINAMLGKISDTQLLSNADVNCDGVADVSDVNCIINTMLDKYPVFYDASVTVDMEGSYDADMDLSTFSTYTFAERAAYYGKTSQCTGITCIQTGPGIYYCSDLFGGYFDQIRGHAFMYRMEGYLRVDNDGNVTLLSSCCPGWEDGLDSVSGGHFDSVTGTLTYDLEYSGIEMHIVLLRQ